MKLGRPQPVLVLTQEQRAQLEVLATSRSLPHGLVTRVRIVLRSAQGRTNRSIAVQLRWTEATVGRWRRRFQAHGISELHDYRRHGTTTLFAALDTASGTVLRRCRRRHRHQEYLDFLRQIDGNVPQGLDVHLIVDNYATHKHPRVKRWLATRPRFPVHFTPTYASWLNQVEIWFHLITRRAIRRGTFRSVNDLTANIDHFVRNYNAKAQPFVWTATAIRSSTKSKDYANVFPGHNTSICDADSRQKSPARREIIFYRNSRLDFPLPTKFICRPPSRVKQKLHPLARAPLGGGRARLEPFSVVVRAVLGLSTASPLTLARQQVRLEPVQRRGQRHTALPDFLRTDQPEGRVHRQPDCIVPFFVAFDHPL